MITDLVPGDKIYTFNHKYNKAELTEFLDYIHIDHTVKQEFVKFYFGTNDFIKITKEHLIYEISKGYMPSSELKVGDYIRYHELLSEKFYNKKIIKIETVEDVGIYAPLTSSGHLLVNSVHVSSYAVIDYQFWGDIASAGYKFLKKFGLLTNLTTKRNENGLLKYFEVIDNLRQNIIPSFFYKKY